MSSFDEDTERSGRSLVASFDRIGPAVFLVLFSFAVLSQGGPAAAEMAGIEIEFYPHGDRSQGHPIRMVFEAEHVVGGRPLEHPASLPAAGSPERLLVEYINVLREGSVEDALEFWSVGERLDTRARLGPSFERHRALMKSISQVNLHLSVRYGRYLILALDHERPEDSDYVSIYPMIETENGYALTNELHQDPMFQILYFAFIDGLGVEDRFRTIN